MVTLQGNLYTVGTGEQGQLGRVAEIFSNRGGRQGLGKLSRDLQEDQITSRRVDGCIDSQWFVWLVHS